MRKLWSNVATGDSGISRERGVEGQLRAAARRSYPNPEDAEDPMMVPPDYLELQNGDLWLRPTDMSWHFPILMTIVKNPSRISVQGHPRNGKKRRTRSRRPRRRPRKSMMDGMVPNGNHHLGHINQ